MTPTPTPDLDLLVLGSGVAGLSAAVRAADRSGLRVGVLTKAELHQSATRWAQGGVAAVLSGGASALRADIESDSTDLHFADTLAAGAGLCDADAVRVLVDEGPTRVQELIALGAIFDRDAEGRLELAREGGHSLARVVHAGGAATGAEVERALVAAVQLSAAAVYEHHFALDLIVEGGRCQGVVALDPHGERTEVRATNVLVTTGGAGQLFAITTNPLEATGDGIAMALRAGVAVADIEFIQFHPTALHHEAMPRPLLSEALRGHGALLRDSHGERFVDEMLPRDVVSRAETAVMQEQEVDHVWLDATALVDFGQRFPTIASALAEVDLDPSRDWLPVAPAAHYTCGGIVTDLDGASTSAGLWAAGEAACTGVHGANRLASNSLLEGMVFGPRAVEAIERGVVGAAASGAMRCVLDDSAPGGIGATLLARPPEVSPTPASAEMPARTSGGTSKDRSRLQQAMTEGAGVLRDEASLSAAEGVLVDLAGGTATGDPAGNELRNLVDVGRALVAAASVRAESRGAHSRRDHPDTLEAFRRRIVVV